MAAIWQSFRATHIASLVNRHQCLIDQIKIDLLVILRHYTNSLFVGEFGLEGAAHLYSIKECWIDLVGVMLHIGLPLLWSSLNREHISHTATLHYRPDLQRYMFYGIILKDPQWWIWSWSPLATCLQLLSWSCSSATAATSWRWGLVIYPRRGSQGSLIMFILAVQTPEKSRQ